MKKALLILASAALLLAGCKKEVVATVENGETVNVTVSTQLQEVKPAVKAVWDNDGNAACVDHWIMEVYDAQGVLYDRQEKSGQSGLTNSFDVVLIKNQSYQFAFWADTEGSYETADLREVKTVSTVAGLDSRDAFFAEVDYKSTKNEAITAKLYRPMAQVNVATLDLNKIFQQMTAAGTTDDYAKFIPTDIKLSCETYNEFNVLTGEVSDIQTSVLTLDECYADYMAHADTTTIFMDYGFAAVEKEVKDLVFSFVSNGETVVFDNFNNIPVQRNYRTNIFGNLLSNDATWNVEIIPIWDGEYERKFQDVYPTGSILAANKALEEGNTNITIDNPEDFASNIVFPAAVEGKDVTITVIGADGKTIHFKNGAAEVKSDLNDGPAKLNIVSDVQNLDINCPKTSVVISKKAGETDFPVVKASELLISGENGTVLKTGTSGKSFDYPLSLQNLEIATDAANTGNGGAINASKSSVFKNVKFTGGAKYILVLGGTNTQMTVKDCNFDNQGKGRGIMVWGGNPVIKVDNCTFDNVYPINVDAGTPEFIVTNSTLNGWTSYTTTANVSFEGCEFGQSTSEWAYCRPYSSTTFTKCNFSSDFLVDFGAADIILTMNGCTVEGSAPVTKAILEPELSKEGTLIIDGKTAYPLYTKDAEGNCHVSTLEGLLKLAQDVNANKQGNPFVGKVIYLESDIDFGCAAWTPMSSYPSGDYAMNFDGKGHKVSNVMIDGNGSKDQAFFGVWAGTIKNFTIDGITVTDGDKRSAALVGTCIANIENCHILNADIRSSNYKVGGLVGSVTAGTSTIKNCSVKNSSIEGLEQVGGFCGSLGTGDGGAAKFIDNVVENITITSSDPVNAKPQTFGAYVGTYYADGYVVENTNNVISGTNDICLANDGFGILLKQ